MPGLVDYGSERIRPVTKEARAPGGLGRGRGLSFPSIAPGARSGGSLRRPLCAVNRSIGPSFVLTLPGARRIGGFDYLTKPFDAVALKETLERVLQRVARGDAEGYRAARLAELRSKMEPAERALGVGGGGA
jgi:hypothetical protein